jgi:Tol biopolymer transport system component
MPDLREVFEMVKQQTEPDQDSWAEQERRMRQAGRKRKIGALALVAALALVVAVVVVTNLDDPGSNVGPAADGSSVPSLVGAEFALVDVATGATTGTGIVPAGSEVDASTDGTKITYVATSDVGEAIHVANADGSNVQAFEQTASPGGGLSAPRWSPDGTKIVYQDRGLADRFGNLYVLDVSSGRVEQITHLKQVSASLYYGLYYMAPTFSEDGASVLFTMPTLVASGGDGPRWDIWSVPANGGEPTLVRRNANFADAEPGGDRIAFTELRAIDGEPTFGDLYVARSDGSDARKLVDGQITQPRWSPDGSQLGYSDAGRNGLFVVDVATGETRQILDYEEWPEWVDQDTMIVDLSD